MEPFVAPEGLADMRFLDRDIAGSCIKLQVEAAGVNFMVRRLQQDDTGRTVRSNSINAFNFQSTVLASSIRGSNLVRQCVTLCLCTRLRPLSPQQAQSSISNVSCPTGGIARVHSSAFVYLFSVSLPVSSLRQWRTHAERCNGHRCRAWP